MGVVMCIVRNCCCGMNFELLMVENWDILCVESALHGVVSSGYTWREQK